MQFLLLSRCLIIIVASNIFKSLRSILCLKLLLNFLSLILRFLFLLLLVKFVLATSSTIHKLTSFVLVYFPCYTIDFCHISIPNRFGFILALTWYISVLSLTLLLWTSLRFIRWLLGSFLLWLGCGLRPWFLGSC